jgi:hypothetical protein
LPLAVGATAQGGPLADRVVTLLPDDRVASARAALADGPKLPRGWIDGLGDVRITQEVLRRLSYLFVPKPKE